jgi:tRNA (cmo5U34)-methyltransferase
MTPQPATRQATIETQLAWPREHGFADVDCFWKYREMALLAGAGKV